MKAVKGGWVNTDFEQEYEATYHITMVTQERKSKYKHKVMFSGQMVAKHNEIQDWCVQSFGPGGRSRKLRWRFGWTDKYDTYYFKSSKDAMLFTLRWSS